MVLYHNFTKFSKINRQSPIVYCFLLFACIWVAGGSLKMAKLFLVVGLAVRCERSEHGESQLSIKYFCTIYTTFLSLFIY